MKMLVNSKIKELRLELGMKQEELAEKLGVSRQAITKWESGVNCPDCENLVKISELFKVSADELLGIESGGDISIEKEMCNARKCEVAIEGASCNSHFAVIAKWIINLCIIMGVGVFVMILLLLILLI